MRNLRVWISSIKYFKLLDRLISGGTKSRLSVARCFALGLISLSAGFSFLGCSSLEKHSQKQNQYESIDRGPAAIRMDFDPQGRSAWNIELTEVAQSFTLEQRLEYTAQLTKLIANEMPLKNSPKKLLLHFLMQELDVATTRIKVNPEYATLLSAKSWGPVAALGESQSAISNLTMELAQIVANAKIVDEAAIYVGASVIVEPDSADVAERLGKLSQVMAAFDSAVSSQGILVAKPEDIELKNWKARMILLRFLSLKIVQDIPQVMTDKSKQVPITNHLTELAAINKFVRNKDQQILQLQALKEKSGWKSISRNLKNIDLAGTGDISGSDFDFEKVMTVQLGFEIVSHLLANDKIR